MDGDANFEVRIRPQVFSWMQESGITYLSVACAIFDKESLILEENYDYCAITTRNARNTEVRMRLTHKLRSRRSTEFREIANERCWYQSIL